jgi:hypothetical protein
MTDTIKQAASATAKAASDAYTATKKALSTAPPADACLRWDAPGVEVMKPDEEHKYHEVAACMNKMQKRNFDLHRHAFRATHVKTQGLVKGTLTVLPNLPQHLRQGLFSEPGKEYPVIVRYANEPVFIQPDNTPGPRGLAMKVFLGKNHGYELLEGADPASTTQDFFFNNTPSIELTDIDVLLDIMNLRLSHFDSPTALQAATALRTDAVKQMAPFLLPNTNIISHALYTQSAFRFGDWYGHMALFPTRKAQTDKCGEKVGGSDDFATLGDWLFDYFKGQDATYDFMVGKTQL